MSEFPSLPLLYRGNRKNNAPSFQKKRSIQVIGIHSAFPLKLNVFFLFNILIIPIFLDLFIHILANSSISLFLAYFHFVHCALQNTYCYRPRRKWELAWKENGKDDSIEEGKLCQTRLRIFS